jgi:glycosyltransferase involved in cell wall biosynthesis
MNIAIDAHSLGTQTGGNETYYRQLIHGLAQDKSNNRYTLFHAHPFTLQEAGNDSRFTLHKIPKNPAIRLCLSLPAKLGRIKPDIFHCQYIQPLWGNRKTVVTVHDLAHEHFPEFFHPLEALRMKRLVRWTAKHADHILTDSEFSATDIATRFAFPRSKITVSYLSSSPEFHPRDKKVCLDHLSKNYGIHAPFILYVGRIQARKNLPRLVEAYARLRSQGANINLVLVGAKDWQFKQLLRKIHQLGLESSVICLGFVPLRDLPFFYGAAELFVFPSFFEGFGLPVIESMASGTPTITSFGSSLQEVAGDGALLIDPYDTNSIAAGMEKVLGDQEFRRELINRGLRRARQFRPEELAQKTLVAYRLATQT